MIKVRQIDIDTALASIPAQRALQGSDLARLVQVRVRMKPESNRLGDEQEHLMLEGELLRFITAMLELHFEPGVNPHINPSLRRKTAVVEKITLTRLRQPEVFWHTTPGLRVGAAKGAAVLNWNEAYVATVWRHPDCIREEAAHQVNTDRDPELPQLPVCGDCRGLKRSDEHTVVPANARCICPAHEVPSAAQPA